MEDLKLPKLTDVQVEQLCKTAEEAARKHILSKISSKQVENLNVSIEAENEKPLRLAVDVDLTLSPHIQNVGVKKLCDEAVKEAFSAAEEYLRKMKCHSQR